MCLKKYISLIYFKLSESLKQDEKSLSKTENENQFDKTLKFLLSELQKVSSKDVIRKLIIKLEFFYLI